MSKDGVVNFTTNIQVPEGLKLLLSLPSAVKGTCHWMAHISSSSCQRRLNSLCLLHHHSYVEVETIGMGSTGGS